jgi:O-acetyl-ADP-ribose deacetylase (regulator of RNase III)/NAD-dependent SIR2 family protein deacetylase
MAEQGHSEPVGRAKISLGFNLPAKYVIHTVGPSISNTKQNPSMEEKTQLASCYRACLDAVETLPIDANGRLSIAFCCISTGLFAFPQDVAAKIAIQTVQQWCEDHADTPITDILFDVFTEEDWALYSKELDKVDLRAASEISRTSTSLQSAIAIEAPASLLQAREWIHSADYLLITAGAGLSAAAGLDYTSRSLFAKHYPAYLKFGLERLYDTIGFAGWPSACEKWGYFFTHANLILQWPKSPLYTSLLSLASNFDKEKYFVRTSNADGLFAANGFPPDRIATPQGQYKYVQCFAKCRPDAVFPMAEYLENALPFIDPETQSLTDPSLIPHCRFCGTELTLCVRGGSYFNEAPFCKQEEAFDDFLEEIEHKNIHGGEPTVVVLELGVGLNTPSVLRWPNEELARSGEGKFKLVRMGLGPSACVPFDLVEEGVAVVVDGDVGDAVGMLTI